MSSTESTDAPSPGPPATGLSRVRAWLELVRIPNLPTAVADVAMGFLFVRGSLEPLGLFALLAGSSALLYLAGMVLNDVFDVAVDTRERPARPLPSGRIPLPLARLAGWEMILLGTALGWSAAYLGGSLRAGLVVSALALCVVLYDALLKPTPLGPPVMGACRGLNVLVGMAASPVEWQTVHGIVALGIGVYVTGVTWLARREAGRSHRLPLAGATLLMAVGIGILASFPRAWGPDGPALAVSESGRLWLWGSLGLLIIWRAVRAVAVPEPRMVQAAVKGAILSLIVLDAAVVLVVCGFAWPGNPWAVVVLALLVPSVFLGRWIYST